MGEAKENTKLKDAVKAAIAQTNEKHNQLVQARKTIRTLQEKYVEGQHNLLNAIKEFGVFEKRVMKLEEWVENEKQRVQGEGLRPEGAIPEQEGGETGAAEVVEEGKA